MSDLDSMTELLARFTQLDEEVSALSALPLFIQPARRNHAIENTLLNDTTDWQAAFYTLRRFPRLA